MRRRRHLALEAERPDVVCLDRAAVVDEQGQLAPGGLCRRGLAADASDGDGAWEIHQALDEIGHRWRTWG
jgi:hypothetical protein